MKQKQAKNSFTIYDDQTSGTVQIADEVITTIAALAATEADGVACLSGSITHDKAARAGERALSKGIRIVMEEGEVSVKANIIMRYGSSIPATTAKVQGKVRTAIETMTGFPVKNVDVNVVDVAVENAQAK